MLVAIFRKAEVLAEKWQHVVLESIGHRAGVGTGVNFEGILDSVVIENLVQLGGIEAQTILIAYIHRDGSIPLEISDVLIDKGQG